MKIEADRTAIKEAIVVALRRAGYNYVETMAEYAVDALEDMAVQQVDLNDDPRLHRGASEAQRMSVAQLIDNGVSDRRLEMLDLVRGYPYGATCDYLEETHGLPHSSASATLNWLENNGLVARDHERKFRTRAGGYANPYEITTAGRKILLANQIGV